LVVYPSVDDLVEANKKVLTAVRVRHADSHRVLSYEKLRRIAETIPNVDGDLYDQSAALLRLIAKEHAFASGNKRTAYLVAEAFMVNNGLPWTAQYEDGVMTGIREGSYTQAEVKDWLTGHGIRPFRRR